MMPSSDLTSMGGERLMISIILKAAAWALAMVPKLGAAPPMRNAPVRTT
jgi:hypothetical protein